MSGEAARIPVGVSVTVTEWFSAAHRLPDYDGPCAWLHGHNYRVEVTAARRERYEPLDEEGFVLDGRILKQEVRAVLSRLDHQDVTEMFSRPTAETMALWLRNAIEELLPRDVRVSRLRLWETNDLFVEVSL